MCRLVFCQSRASVFFEDTFLQRIVHTDKSRDVIQEALNLFIAKSIHFKQPEQILPKHQQRYVLLIQLGVTDTQVWCPDRNLRAGRCAGHFLN
jgi:hypothetical protein